MATLLKVRSHLSGHAGADLHTLDETVPDEIDVLHHLVEDDFAGKIANRLMDLHDGSTGWVGYRG